MLLLYCNLCGKYGSQRQNVCGKLLIFNVSTYSQTVLYFVGTLFYIFITTTVLFLKSIFKLCK